MNLDEAMYTIGTGENFHHQNYLGEHELEGEEGFILEISQVGLMNLWI